MVCTTYVYGPWSMATNASKNNFSAKYDNGYFFCSRYFRFLVFVRQPAIYTVENRYKPTRRRFVPEKMTKCHKLIQLGSKPVCGINHHHDVYRWRREKIRRVDRGGGRRRKAAHLNSHCGSLENHHHLMQVMMVKVETAGPLGI